MKTSEFTWSTNHRSNRGVVQSEKEKLSSLTRETEGGGWQLGVSKFSLKAGGFPDSVKRKLFENIFWSSRKKKETLNPLRGCCVLQYIFFSLLLGKRVKKLYVESVVLPHNSDFCCYGLAKQMCSN